MIEISDKMRQVMWATGTIILLLLSLYMIETGKKYDCDKCEVVFKNEIANLNQGYYEYGTYKVETLFNELIQNNTCIIKWDKIQGYYGGQGNNS